MGGYRGIEGKAIEMEALKELHGLLIDSLSQFKFSLLHVRIYACLLSHHSSGIHEIWGLTLSRDGYVLHPLATVIGSELGKLTQAGPFRTP